MPTTTNYGWTTPADTDLVKDGAAAIRTLGTAIDTTVFNNASAAIAKTIVDAKGDLIVGTAADTVARLAVGGTNNHVLTVDSSTATGLKWAAAGGALNYTLANAGGTALTGANTITVSGLSNANFIQVWVWGASTASATNKDCLLRINTDSGTNYQYIGIKTNAAAHAHETFVGSDNGTDIPLFTFGADAAAVGNAIVDIQGGASTGRKPFMSNARSADGWGGEFVWTLQGAYIGSSAISSVSLICTSSTFDAGTIYVYTSA